MRRFYKGALYDGRGERVGGIRLLFLGEDEGRVSGFVMAPASSGAAYTRLSGTYQGQSFTAGGSSSDRIVSKTGHRITVSLGGTVRDGQIVADVGGSLDGQPLEWVGQLKRGAVREVIRTLVGGEEVEIVTSQGETDRIDEAIEDEAINGTSAVGEIIEDFEDLYRRIPFWGKVGAVGAFLWWAIKKVL